MAASVSQHNLPPKLAPKERTECISYTLPAGTCTLRPRFLAKGIQIVMEATPLLLEGPVHQWRQNSLRSNISVGVNLTGSSPIVHGYAPNLFKMNYIPQ